MKSGAPELVPGAEPGPREEVIITRPGHALLKRINLLLADTQRNGNDGIGKPEALKHDFAGYWSQRITDEQRLVYEVVDQEVHIAACRYRYG